MTSAKLISTRQLELLLLELQKRRKIPRKFACRAAKVPDLMFSNMRNPHITTRPIDVLKLAKMVKKWVPPGHERYKTLEELIEGLEKCMKEHEKNTSSLE